MREYLIDAPWWHLLAGAAGAWLVLGGLVRLASGDRRGARRGWRP